MNLLNLICLLIGLSVSSAFVTRPGLIQTRQDKLNLPTNVISQVRVPPPNKVLPTKLYFDMVGIEQIILVGAIGSSVAYAYLNRENEEDESKAVTETVIEQKPVVEIEKADMEVVNTSTDDDETLSPIRSPDVSVVKRAVASTKELVTERLQRLQNSNLDSGEPVKKIETVQKKISNSVEEEKVNKKPRIISRLARKILLPWTKF